MAQFSLAEINKAAAIFNPEKLLWLNAHYLRTLPSERLIDELLPHMMRAGNRRNLRMKSTAPILPGRWIRCANAARPWSR